MNARVDDGRASVLVISHELVGPRMAGPGIRYHQLARVLAAELPVTLAAPLGSQTVSADDGYRLHAYTPFVWESLRPAFASARVVVAASDMAALFPPLAAGQVPLVIDGYDPLLAETLFLRRGRPIAEQATTWRQRMDGLRPQYRAGDFFICASERQRDWWLGLLESHGRVNPWTLAADASLRQLIDVVPFGLDPAAIEPGPAVMRGVWPGIAPEDRVVLWGGGLWPWLDPFTAIRAVQGLVQDWPTLRLVFPGTRHPNPDRAQDTPTLLAAAQALVAELGLERHVVFSDWIAYREWPQLLLESDVALSLHAQETVESRLAFRSRVLEYIRADLPIVATHGDATAELIETHRLGTLVPGGDVEAVAGAVAACLAAGARGSAEFAAARQVLSWQRASQPLLRFCQAPFFAADKPALADLDLQQAQALKNEVHRRQRAEEELGRVNRMRFVRFVRWLAPIRKRIGL